MNVADLFVNNFCRISFRSIIVPLLFCGYVSFAQNGNVGIGTTAPTNRLDVRSDGVADTTEIVLGLISNTSNRPVLQFSETSFADPNQGMSIEYNGVGSTSENKLHIRGTDAVRRFTVMTSGKVGINMETPTRELSIFDIGNNGDAIIELESSFGGAKEMVLGVNTTSGGLIGTSTNTNLTLRTNGTTRMAITGAGNVGIGTVSPAQKLHVAGGSLQVDQNVELDTGEVRRAPTMDANLVPICYGHVQSNGNVISGTGNFSVDASEPGFYQVTIDDVAYNNEYVAIAIAHFGSLKFASPSPYQNKLLVTIFNLSEELSAASFSFVVYKP